MGAARVVLFTIQKDPATCARIGSGQDLDQGGFPRAIFPNQAVNGVPFYNEADIVDRPHAREILYKLLDLQHILCRFMQSSLNLTGGRPWPSSRWLTCFFFELLLDVGPELGVQPGHGIRGIVQKEML